MITKSKSHKNEDQNSNLGALISTINNSDLIQIAVIAAIQT
jgi:hypothetical protein